jgi:hypothetical protein
MLPDFPEEKAKLMQFWMRYFDRQYRHHLGFVGEVPSYRHYEGRDWRIAREDGTIAEASYDEVSAIMEIPTDDLPYLTPDQLAQHVDNIARDMASQVTRRFYEDVAAVAVRTDAQGRPFGQDLFLEMIESLLVEFNQDGTPNLPSMVVHPAMWESIQDDVATWDNDEEFRLRFRDVINRKREEWRAREGHRKLVE